MAKTSEDTRSRLLGSCYQEKSTCKSTGLEMPGVSRWTSAATVVYSPQRRRVPQESSAVRTSSSTSSSIIYSDLTSISPTKCADESTSGLNVQCRHAATGCKQESKRTHPMRIHYYQKGRDIWNQTWYRNTGAKLHTDDEIATENPLLSIMNFINQCNVQSCNGYPHFVGQAKLTNRSRTSS